MYGELVKHLRFCGKCNDAIEQLRDEYNNIIFKAVKKCCPQVDEDELIKALRYDREQYEKGYRDGRLYQPPVLTNADRIRSMSDEELAEWVWGAETAGRAYGPRGKNSWLDWMKQEAET